MLPNWGSLISPHRGENSRPRGENIRLVRVISPHDTFFILRFWNNKWRNIYIFLVQKVTFNLRQATGNRNTYTKAYARIL